jgi:anti-sigma-K factor RskA
MIDERQQELAALYALGLLEGKDRTAFESQLNEDGKLQELVRELRESSAAIALSAPQVTPSAELRARVLNSIREAAPFREQSLLARPAVLIPWSIAIALVIGCFWLGNVFMQSRATQSVLEDQERLSRVEVASAQNQLEAERILFNRQLSDATKELTELNQQLVLSTEKIVEATGILGETFAQLDDARSQLTARQAKVEDLSNQLGFATHQISLLREQLRSQGDLGEFKIARLVPNSDNSSPALAVAVWNPAKQEGILRVDRLPAPGADKDYQLWVFDPAYPDPVDAGVFAVDSPTGHAQISFKPNHPVDNAKSFAVSLERKGGAPKVEGPIVLRGE